MARRGACPRPGGAGGSHGGLTPTAPHDGADDGRAGGAIIRGHRASIERFTADGAYDTRAIYEALTAVGGVGVNVIIPPKMAAAPSASRDEVLRQRDEAIAQRAEVGRRRWRKEAGAHSQARAENAMLRYKRIIGEALRAKKMTTQATETRIGVSVLNRMTTVGAPVSVAIVS